MDEEKASKAHISIRTVKTALAAMLCALIYMPFERNPAFACIGAVFGTGTNPSTSWLYGGNRLFGTIFGGLIGMALFSIYVQVYPQGGLHPLMLLLLPIGVVMMIVLCNAFNWPGAVQPGGVMLCIVLFNQSADSYIVYSINRILDTGFGVLVAMGINWLLPRTRIVHWLDKLHLKHRNLML